MTQIRWVAVLLLIALTAAPAASQGGGDAAKPLLGKWQKTIKMDMKDVPVTVVFAADNKLTVLVRDFKIMGTYKVVDDTHIEVDITFNGQTKRDRSEFKITGDTLILKDSTGKEDKYQKAK